MEVSAQMICRLCQTIKSPAYLISFLFPNRIIQCHILRESDFPSPVTTWLRVTFKNTTNASELLRKISVLTRYVVFMFAHLFQIVVFFLDFLNHLTLFIITEIKR